MGEIRPPTKSYFRAKLVSLVLKSPPRSLPAALLLSLSSWAFSFTVRAATKTHSKLLLLLYANNNLCSDIPKHFHDFSKIPQPFFDFSKVTQVIPAFTARLHCMYCVCILKRHLLPVVFLDLLMQCFTKNLTSVHLEIRIF